MILIKLGGNALAASMGLGWLDAIAAAHESGHQVVLVHGGGPQIDEEFQIHSLPKIVMGGYRVTDEKAFEVVEMVLAGRVQQALVRVMKSKGLPVVGITGSDGALFDVTKKYAPDGSDLGQVGEVSTVNPKIVMALLASGYLPVVSPVSSDESGKGFNVNADIAAGALAGSLNADKAIFMTDVPGIFRNFPDPVSILERTSLAELKSLLPALSEGMVPKVEAVINALESGAKSAYVIDGRSGEALTALLSGSRVGTEITKDEN